MALSASTKNALRISLGQQAGTEMINAIDGFADTLKALATPAEPAPEPSADPAASLVDSHGKPLSVIAEEAENFDAPEEEPKLPVGLDPTAPKGGVEKTPLTGTEAPKPQTAVGEKDPVTGIASGPMVPVVGPPDNKNNPKDPAPHA